MRFMITSNLPVPPAPLLSGSRRVPAPSGLEAGAIALVAAAAAWVPWRAPLNHDVAFLLFAARRVLDGARLYVDIYEGNPPLIVWLSAIPELLVRVARVSDHTAVALFLDLTLLTATSVTWAVLYWVPSAPRWLRVTVIVTFLVGGSWLSVDNLGQREHLAVLLSFPYCVTLYRRVHALPTPAWLLVVIGAMAGLGLALKPHFLLPLLVLEAAQVTWSRDLRSVWRLDLAIALVLQAATLALVVVATPEYVTRMLPLLRRVYWAYNVGHIPLLQSRRVWVLAWTLLVGLVAGSQRIGGLAAPIIGSVSAFGLGFLGVYLAQAKGFSYHQLPALVAAWMVAVLLAVQLGAAGLAGLRCQSLPRLLSGVAALILVLTVAVQFVSSGGLLARRARQLARPRETLPPGLVDFVQLRAAGEPIYVLSTSVWPAFPLVNLTGATWPYRYHHLWPLPAFYQRPPAWDRIPYHPPHAQGPAEREFFTEVVDDLVARPPRLLIVDRRQYRQALAQGDFDFLEYFSQAPRFAALLSRYTRVGVANGFVVYERSR